MTLDPGQSNYLTSVLRLKPGESVLLFDGESGEWLARVAEARKKRTTLLVGERTRPVESVPDVVLAFAPIKKGRVDWLVEKAVELGAARLHPVITARTIIGRFNLDRMRAHIIEAAEQCSRTVLADICEPETLQTFLSNHENRRTLYFADERGGSPADGAFRAGPATILTGPEGGFTEDERSAIRSLEKTVPISLGPRILRAETAALAALTAYMALAGDWR